MQKTETISTTVKKIVYFCDICEEKIPENYRYMCSNCRKDLCREHSKVFIKNTDWQNGIQFHHGRNIKICLCLECRVTPMSYEEALEKMGFRGG